MGSQTNVLMYFLQAGMVVKSVMLLLLAASIISWTLIFQKGRFFSFKKQSTEDFMERFWDSDDLSKLYTEVDQETELSGMAAIFHAGFREFIRVSKQGILALEPIQRVMQINQAKESEILEQHLPFFASVGSIAPYVGLFGTVWGIMTSFQALGHAQQATIAMVAPGISEALVATALGLFTAIPAVIAYNRYTTKANNLMHKYDIFQEELIALIEEQTSQRGS